MVTSACVRSSGAILAQVALSPCLRKSLLIAMSRSASSDSVTPWLPLAPTPTTQRESAVVEFVRAAVVAMPPTGLSGGMKAYPLMEFATCLEKYLCKVDLRPRDLCFLTDMEAREMSDALTPSGMSPGDTWIPLTSVIAYGTSIPWTPVGQPQAPRLDPRLEVARPPPRLEHTKLEKRRRATLWKIAMGYLKAARVSPQDTSLEARDRACMKKALGACHKVFLLKCRSSKRFAQLAAPQTKEALTLALDLQMKVYRTGSSSHKVVAQRARDLARVLDDWHAMGWSVPALSEWQVATWIASQASRGRGPKALHLMRLLGQVTGEYTFSDNDLVVAQSKVKEAVGGTKEPPTPAVPIPLDVLTKLERLIESAPTAQMRCYAGFFAFLGLSSSRGLDGQRSRRLVLDETSLRGQSRMKGRANWTPWFCPARGLHLDNWAALWMQQLHSAGLPGEDFILAGTNLAMTGWTLKPADTDMLERNLRTFLTTVADVPVSTALGYTVHGLRHSLMAAAVQLRHQGLLVPEALEEMGHWATGSAMPRKYDSAIGVTELSTRCTVLDALRSGWKPAPTGSLPEPYVPPPELKRKSTLEARIAASRRLARKRCPPPLPTEDTPTAVETYRFVSHAVTGKVHVCADGPTTVCKWWTCGTPRAPSVHATFNVNQAQKPTDDGLCTACSRWLKRLERRRQ